MSGTIKLAKLPEITLPEDEQQAMENAAYRDSVAWHDDRIADILREREQQGRDLAESTPAVRRLLKQGIHSIEEGMPSPLFMALLHALAEDAAEEMDNALRAVAATQKIKLANRNRKRNEESAMRQQEVRQAWQNRHAHPQHGHRFADVAQCRQLALFEQFIATGLESRTIKKYLRAHPNLLDTPAL